MGGLAPSGQLGVIREAPEVSENTFQQKQELMEIDQPMSNMKMVELEDDEGYNSYEEVDEDDLGDEMNASDEEQEFEEPVSDN